MSHQVEVVEMTQSLELGRHQVASPEGQLKATGSSHPQHPPNHNEVQPFIKSESSSILNLTKALLFQIRSSHSPEY